MHCKLKILSGQLDGVEFACLPGDTIFLVGAVRELDGEAAVAAAQAENVYRIPDAGPVRDLLVRVAVGPKMESLGVSLAERDATGNWMFESIARNVVHRACGLHLAVAGDDESWSEPVANFRAEPKALATPVPTPPVRPIKRTAAAVAAVVAGVGLIAGIWMWQHSSERQVRGLAELLKGAPMAYTVAQGRDGGLYAFSDDPAAIAWGQRASARALRTSDHFIDTRQEVERLGRVLEAAGLEWVTLRLRQPGQPEVVLSGASADRALLQQQAWSALAPHMPYAQNIEVAVISDAQLLAIAQAQLREVGIASRLDLNKAPLSISNAVFLDDAGLHLMQQQVEDFSRRWGQRRVRINIRLWDDLLQGRSYQYSPHQLLSVGDGRWEYSYESSL